MTQGIVLGDEQLGTRFRLGIDGVTLLSIYLFLLVAIPSQFVVGPLGGAGTPSLLVGVGCLMWWIFARIRGGETRWASRQPIGLAAGGFATAIALSYVAACLRPTNAEEMNIATLGLITVAGWLGVLFLAHDGVVDRDRLEKLVGRLTLAGTALAAFGLFQFATHQPWTDHIAIPGLRINNVLYGTQTREGFTRPSGTAIHPIEFGSVLTQLLPITIARAAGRPGSVLRRWLPPGLILLAITLSSSRSALVTAAVGCVVLLPVLTKQMRRAAVAALGVLAVTVFVMVPGMLGTLLGLFTDVGADPSSLSRFDSYGVAGEYLQQAPFFGRGLATFLPRYRIFDNEYLLLLVEVGVVGVVAVLVLLGCALWVGNRCRRAAPDLRTKLTAQGLVGGVAAGGMSLALFDAFSFPMVPGMLFLLVGMLGALQRLGSPAATPEV